MKIIEALKELPLIQKKIDKKISEIQQYASAGSDHEESLAFGSVKAQEKEVDSLLQSVNDLVNRQAEIRKNLAVTNASIRIEINGLTMSISEWIAYRETGIDNLLRANQALNTTAGQKQLQQGANNDIEKGVRLVRFYDEKEKNDAHEALVELRSKIDSTLEVVNATNDLVEAA